MISTSILEQHHSVPILSQPTLLTIQQEKWHPAAGGANALRRNKFLGASGQRENDQHTKYWKDFATIAGRQIDHLGYSSQRTMEARLLESQYSLRYNKYHLSHCRTQHQIPWTSYLSSQRQSKRQETRPPLHRSLPSPKPPLRSPNP